MGMRIGWNVVAVYEKSIAYQHLQGEHTKESPKMETIEEYLDDKTVKKVVDLFN